MPVYIIALPLVGALIGWITNRLAIRMLFHPRNPKIVLGFRWQGLIPQRHAEIAEKAGSIVAEELIGQKVLRKAIEDIDVEPALNDAITHLVWERLGPRLRGIPLFGRMVNDKMMAQIHIQVADELHQILPSMRERVGQAAEAHINLKQMVSERVLAFEIDQLEGIIYQLANREFRQIEWLGAFLGFVIGIFQVLVVWLTN